MTTRIRTAVLGWGLVGLMTGAQAAPVIIANGAFAATWVRDCRSAAVQAAGGTVPDLCNDDPLTAPPGSFANNVVERQANLRAGSYTASMIATHALGVTALGATQSSVNAAGATGSLNLHQGAFTAEPYARVSGHSNALQSFFYSGSGPSTRTLQSTLNYTAADLQDQAGFRAATITPASMALTAVRVFSLPVGYFNFDWTRLDVEFGGSLGNGFFEVAQSAAAGFREEAVRQDFASGAGPLVTSLTFSLQAGRFYFVESYLGLWAKFGAHIDATHTFVTEFGVTEAGVFRATLEGLTPSAEGLLPEPPAGALALLALAGLALAPRRRRHAEAARSA